MGGHGWACVGILLRGAEQDRIALQVFEGLRRSGGLT